MDLSVGERMVLLMVFPRDVEPTMVRIANKTREELSFTEDEHERWGIKTTDDGVAWSTEGDQMRGYEFGPKAHAFLAGILASAPKLPATPFAAAVCEKFGVGEVD